VEFSQSRTQSSYETSPSLYQSHASVDIVSHTLHVAV